MIFSSSYSWRVPTDSARRWTIKTTTDVRILFAFDPWSQAILLVAGNKAGDWTRWYKAAILFERKRREES